MGLSDISMPIQGIWLEKQMVNEELDMYLTAVVEVKLRKKLIEFSSIKNKLYLMIYKNDNTLKDVIVFCLFGRAITIEKMESLGTVMN